MGTVKCPLCGTEINEETARCPECGHDPRLPTSSAEVELWEEHGTKTVAQLVPLGTRLAIAAGIAGLIAAVLVVTQGVSWAADMTEYGVGPGVPMIRTGIFWAVAAGVALLAAAAMPNRRWTAVLLALLSTAIGFLGALLAAGPSASEWGAPYWFADPRDHAVLAVLWLPAALLLTAAVLLTLEAPQDLGSAVPEDRRDPSGGTSRRWGTSPLMSPIGLSVLATGLSLGLALLVGLRGEVWVHAYGDIDAGASPSDPMAWLSLMWGLATLVAFAAMFMLRRGRRRLGACCALAAAAFGLTAALTAGYVADSRVVAMLWQNETALADPTKRQALALVWLIALVPLATAAGLAFQPIRASVDERRRFSGGIITAFGGAVAVVGAFLPWVDIHDPYSAIIVRNAFELGGLRLGADPRFSADGLVVVILGLVAVSIGVVVAARASVPRFIRWSPIIAGVCLAIASAARFGSIHGFATRLTAAFPDVSGSLGIGWWAALSGALLIIAGGLVAKSKPTATEAHSAGVHATSSPA